MKPKAILFDWDNTLVDTWPVIHAALERTFTAFGLVPWTFEETKARVRRSMRESFPPLFGERWEEAGDYFYACFKENHLEGLTPCDGAEDMLRRLHDEGVYLGIVSNKNGDLLREEAEHLEWRGFLAPWSVRSMRLAINRRSILSILRWKAVELHAEAMYGSRVTRGLIWNVPGIAVAWGSWSARNRRSGRNSVSACRRCIFPTVERFAIHS